MSVGMNQEEVIHISAIVSHGQFTFDELVEPVEEYVAKQL